MHVVNAAVLEEWNQLSDDEVVGQVLQGQTALVEVLMRHPDVLTRVSMIGNDLALDTGQFRQVHEDAHDAVHLPPQSERIA